MATRFASILLSYALLSISTCLIFTSLLFRSIFLGGFLSDVAATWLSVAIRLIRVARQLSGFPMDGSVLLGCGVLAAVVELSKAHIFLFIAQIQLVITCFVAPFYFFRKFIIKPIREIFYGFLSRAVSTVSDHSGYLYDFIVGYFPSVGSSLECFARFYNYVKGRLVGALSTIQNELHLVYSRIVVLVTSTFAELLYKANHIYGITKRSFYDMVSTVRQFISSFYHGWITIISTVQQSLHGNGEKDEPTCNAATSATLNSSLLSATSAAVSSATSAAMSSSTSAAVSSATSAALSGATSALASSPDTAPAPPVASPQAFKWNPLAQPYIPSYFSPLAEPYTPSYISG